MIEFKKPIIKNAEEIYLRQRFEDLYTQFNNAIKEDHTYLKITQSKTGGETFRFIIVKRGDGINTDDSINVICEDDETFKYFRVYNPFSPFSKSLDVLKLEMPRKVFDIHGEANPMFIDELDKSYNIVEFQTKEEYKNQRDIERLEKKIERLEEKITGLALKVEQLERTKKDKFFI